MVQRLTGRDTTTPPNRTYTASSRLQIPHSRPTEYKRSRLPRNRRTINCAYCGVLSALAVCERIVRAFLVKKVLKLKKAHPKA